MTSSRSRLLNVLRISLPLIITALWLGFIYSNSLKSGTESSSDSGKVQEIVNDVASNMGYEKPVSEKFIRKSAHFTEFAVLSTLICFDMWAFGLISHKKRLYISALFILSSIPVSAVFASIDEFLQSFSVERGPSVTDVLIDTSGAAFASLAFLLLFTLFVFILKKFIKKYGC